MATQIRNNRTINGITLPPKNKHEAKISMLADDTTIFVQDESSVIKVLRAIEEFGKVAGPKLNKQKTVGMKLGCLRNNNINVTEITWASDHIKALGIYFGHDIKSRTKLNWENAIKAVEKRLELWKRRKLSLVGRILIVKSFGISKLVHLSSTIACSEDFVKKIHTLIYNFIWQGKRDHVKRDTIIASKEEGGLNMINFRLLDKSLKVTMLKRIIEPGNERWKILPQYYLNIFGPEYLILHINALERKIIKELMIPNVYKDIISAWQECRHNPRDVAPSNVREIQNQILWENNLIRFHGKRFISVNGLKKELFT